MNRGTEFGLCLLGTGMGLGVDLTQTPFTLFASLCVGHATLGSAASLDLWMMPYSHFGMLLGLAVCGWPETRVAGQELWRHAASRMVYMGAMFLGMLSAEVMAMSLPVHGHSFALMVAAMLGGMIATATACTLVSARLHYYFQRLNRSHPLAGGKFAAAPHLF
jgi:hypothetical protein